MAVECEECVNQTVQHHGKVLDVFEERFATIIKMLFGMFVTIIGTLVSVLATLGVLLYNVMDNRLNLLSKDHLMSIANIDFTYWWGLMP